MAPINEAYVGEPGPVVVAAAADAFQAGARRTLGDGDSGANGTERRSADARRRCYLDSPHTTRKRVPLRRCLLWPRQVGRTGPDEREEPELFRVRCSTSTQAGLFGLAMLGGPPRRCGP